MANKVVSVLGEGAWGTAIATVLAANGYKVNLWCHDERVVSLINTKHLNEQYLPSVVLSTLIVATTDIQAALSGTQFIFEAVPTEFLHSVVSQAVKFCSPKQTWVVLSKGIDKDLLLFPSQIIQKLCGASTQVALVSGPSFAHEVAQKKMTAVVIAADDFKRAVAVQQIITTDFFKPYILSDVIGVSAVSAFKNVVALAVGLADGAGYADNFKAFLITLGLREMMTFSCALGGQDQTALGLAGIGDLVLTSLGRLSRNLKAGQLISQGASVQEIRDQFKMYPESLNTLDAIIIMSQHKKLSLPLCEGVHQIIKQKEKAKDVFDRIINYSF